AAIKFWGDVKARVVKWPNFTTTLGIITQDVIHPLDGFAYTMNVESLLKKDINGVMTIVRILPALREAANTFGKLEARTPGIGFAGKQQEAAAIAAQFDHNVLPIVQQVLQYQQ